MNTLQNKNFLLFSLAGSFATGILFVYIATISNILLSTYEIDKQTFGILFGLNAAGYILGSQINRFLLKYFPIHPFTKTITLLLLLTLICFGFIYYFTIQIPLPIFCIFTFLTLFFVGFINPNGTALSLSFIKNNIGVASAMNGSLRMGFGAIGSSAIALMPFENTEKLIISCVILSGAAYYILQKKSLHA